MVGQSHLDINTAMREKLKPATSADIAPSFCTLDYTRDPGASRLAVRLQRPTVVAELSFILAVAKFAYPSFAVSGGARGGWPWKASRVLTNLQCQFR